MGRTCACLAMGTLIRHLSKAGARLEQQSPPYGGIEKERSERRVPREGRGPSFLHGRWSIGRIGFLDLTPFLSRSFLARSERASADWRESYVRTFLEQDVPALGLRLPAVTLRRFWTMLAH